MNYCWSLGGLSRAEAVPAPLQLGPNGVGVGSSLTWLQSHLGVHSSESPLWQHRNEVRTHSNECRENYKCPRLTSKPDLPSGELLHVGTCRENLSITV